MPPSPSASQPDRQPPRPEHPFVRGLRRKLTEDVQPEIQLAVRVGVMSALGVSRTEIGRRVGVSPAELKRAFERLERVAPQLDRGNDLSDQ